MVRVHNVSTLGQTLNIKKRKILLKIAKITKIQAKKLFKLGETAEI
jgi:hypothetical protein